MLGNPPYYFASTQKIINVFGYIFSDISIQRIDPNTQAIKTIKVPIEWSSKERFDLRLRDDPNAGDPSTQRPISLILPRMGYDLLNVELNTKRKLAPTNFKVAPARSGGSALKQLSAVPMLFDFALYLQTRNLDDAWQVIEQITPFFAPDLSLSIIDLPEMGIKRDLTFTLVSRERTDTYDNTDLGEKRVIEHTFRFIAQGFYYYPIKTKPLITAADISTFIYTDPELNQPPIIYNELLVAAVDPPTANIADPFDIHDYQMNLFSADDFRELRQAQENESL